MDLMAKVGLFFNPDPVFNFHLVLSPFEFSKQHQNQLGRGA